MGVGGQGHAPAALPPGKRPGTHFTGGWGGPQGRSGRVWKISAPPAFDPRPLQPIEICHTDSAIGAHRYLSLRKLNVLRGRHLGIKIFVYSCNSFQYNYFSIARLKTKD